uniref:Uncharacterized protein n=1 Tax=Nothoprocta perdicaria TaxID=30464 RepID=A0A8C6ZDM6_NOTPE
MRGSGSQLGSADPQPGIGTAVTQVQLKLMQGQVLELQLQSSPHKKQELALAEVSPQSCLATTSIYPQQGVQSTVISRRSRLQSCSKHQTKSVQSCDGVSDLDSYKSNRTESFCLMSPSKRNRPQSAPTGSQTVFPPSPSTEHYHAQKASALCKVIKQQPNIIKVIAHKTVFLADGTEALEPKDIPREADVCISTGEPFSEPLKKKSKEVTWAVNGLVLCNDKIREDLIVLVFKNSKISCLKLTLKRVVGLCPTEILIP